MAYRYNAAGFLERVQSPDGASVYYQLVDADADAAGRMSLRWLGDGSVKSQSYDGASIRITHQHTSAASGDTLQQFTYNYDDVGNMSERQDNLHQIAEQFSFDHLDRLTQAQVAGASPITFGFDNLGNMTEKSDLASAYQYTTAKLHAVTQLQNAGTTKSIQYDANGNLTSGDDMPSVTWTSYNKPSRIQKGKVMYNFYYGSDRKRYKKLRFKTATHYVGDSVEIIQTATPEIRYTLKANGVAFMVRRERGSSVDHHYLHRDHLGSITAVTDEASGQVVERYSYDAWGKRRTATNWQAADITTALNYRGYTGHEHLDDVGIIHMNGRIYLPELGKMMSPDPITQSPENGQNYSRYSYVFNNPLKFTDPSGYKSDIDSEHVKPVSAPAYEGSKPLEHVRVVGSRGERRSAAEIMGSSFGISDYISSVYQSGAGGSNEPRERGSDDPRTEEGDNEKFIAFKAEYEDILKIAGIDIDKNIMEAQQMSLAEWIEAVRTGGKWDYKVDVSLINAEISKERLDEFGNVHFGIVAAAYGFDLATTLFGAGSYQVFFQSGGSLWSWGNAPFLASNGTAEFYTRMGWGWGDNPGDSADIMKGWNIYNEES